MRVYVHSFSEPKRGSSPEEDEDAVWIPTEVVADEFIGADFRAALSDGATESLLARYWSHHLVEVFGSADRSPCTESGFTAAYMAAIARWQDFLAGYVRDRHERGSPISWYEEPGIERGAFATLLVLELCENHSWRAAAVGDSCLFQVRDDQLVAAFPFDNASSFSLQPPLLRSRDPDDARLMDHLRKREGEWEPDDRFFLASDALASWLLASVDADGSPWAVFYDLSTQDELRTYSELVDQERDCGRLKNDDTTMVRIEVC